MIHIATFIIKVMRMLRTARKAAYLITLNCPTFPEDMISFLANRIDMILRNPLRRVFNLASGTKREQA
jgi:hypothetical protein